MERIESVDDPRVAAYRNLRDRTLRGESLFVTEGRVLTRRLLESPYAAESVFVADGYLEEFRGLVPSGVPIYVAPERLLLEVVGFRFHRGVLAAGRRPDVKSLAELLSGNDLAGAVRLVVCPEITKPENLGLVFRSAAAFGVDGVLLGPRCCDPFSRRSLRVSMGGTLQVPHARSADMLADLRALEEVWKVELVAAVVDPAAERLGEMAWPARWAVVVGNETDGLGDACVAACHRRATIPMRAGVDSLNLGVAAGIFLYAMCKDV